ncbi:hypothetical protein FJV41_19045 [Myxococcus llanfairpwllgwyngyllgogerychwyrndrobwllllantysiliogogogochensis]|uniref:Uncharacterized protein n=1 Tax=Myxococcus llanfairpwllgwyngyllgogerychwyrndrobwllllantysiliogogogochensis TaxID=2590453 RepID=A0A540WZG1_9BACT|nr:hypothetical protein [Myxococcus llanfairpwllgwyngyllgogerychwyrndrobwllllantysiliogogogochensis]TQF14396.1 hypothetical protein FJV41_19045 [Myxococcus llanfairpwllgwyngyllgogerychwyrndrobwllllantysiliogogogochensis]
MWLVEPTDAPPTSMPVIGDVKLTAGGELYNPVTNATSSKPFSPDIAIYDVPQFAQKFPKLMGGKKLSPREKSLILEVVIRGSALKKEALETAELELGFLPPGSTPESGVTPRYVSYRAKLKRR